MNKELETKIQKNFLKFLESEFKKNKDLIKTIGLLDYRSRQLVKEFFNEKGYICSFDEFIDSKNKYEWNSTHINLRRKL